MTSRIPHRLFKGGLTGRRLRIALILFALPVMALGALLALQSRSDAESLGRLQGTLIALGDIGRCDMSSDEKVAKAVRKLPGTIAILGDAVYWAGHYTEYKECFDPAWGKMKARMRPVPGNHDYQTKGAAGYFKYFGSRAGAAGKGYYSYDIGAWHIVGINSNCPSIGGCDEGSPQYEWLKADLAANDSACTLAYWHHPVFNQEPAPDHVRAYMKPVWSLLQSRGADVVLMGHTHNYQRFAPLTSAGAVDAGGGLTSFIVGSGGSTLHPVPKKRIANGLQAKADRTYGVLQMKLYAEGYSWRYVNVAGRAMKDSGEALCR